MEILASRILLRPADYERSLRFYRDELELAIARDYGAGVVFFAGQSLIELAGRGVQIAREARQEPWGLHEMHVTDPDGVTLIFVQVPANHPLRRDTRA